MVARLMNARLVFLVLIAGCASGPPVGSTAPDFAAADTAGNPVSLAAYENSVLILDFWAVW